MDGYIDWVFIHWRLAYVLWFHAKIMVYSRSDFGSQIWQEVGVAVYVEDHSTIMKSGD